ncbi:MAG: hypothetical protein IJZ52_02525 [Clostridium sp.]|nr:hypothetical protein [Clostridium sp.]
MQTIYTTSYRLGVRDNVIDLNAYRRSLEMSVEEPEEEIEVEPLLWATQQEERPVRRSRARRAASVSAWAMDIMASAGVLAMTMVFTMAVL